MHAYETETEVLLPEHAGVDDYELLWDSAREEPDGDLHAAPSATARDVTAVDAALPRPWGAVGPATPRASTPT